MPYNEDEAEYRTQMLKTLAEIANTLSEIALSQKQIANQLYDIYNEMPTRKEPE